MEISEVKNSVESVHSINDHCEERVSNAEDKIVNY